jgi:Pyruvate/2-oxoacid:ferredoxin oxidoreductase gamma subunit
MLGAMIAAVPIVPAERLEHALEERFGRIAAKNISAFRRAQKETAIIDAA